jgi:hypothetical protein
MHKARDFSKKPWGRTQRPADFAPRENGLANPIAHADHHGEKAAPAHAHRTEGTRTNEKHRQQKLSATDLKREELPTR